MTVSQRDLLALWFTQETAKQGGLEPSVYNEDMKVCVGIYEHMRRVVEEIDVERSNNATDTGNNG